MSNFEKMSDFERIIENLLTTYYRKNIKETIMVIAAEMTKLEYEEHTRRIKMGDFPFERVFEKWIDICWKV